MTDSLDTPAIGLDVAVIVPCFNEEITIGSLVEAIARSMPQARLVVVDNNSRDETAARARAAGAEVMRVTRQGKGNAIRAAFDRIDADVYVMLDGDGTYDPAEAPLMIQRLVANGLDMVVGARRDVTVDAGRRGHALGNLAFNALYAALFGQGYKDIFSGYRVFSRRYVKTFPATSSGFEIETEMSVHAQLLNLEVEEVPVSYGRRPSGSSSKLSTHRDGIRILAFLLLLAKEVRPFAFFASLAALCSAGALGLGLPIVLEFLRTGLVARQPTWLLAVGLAIVAMNMLFSGVILDSVARGRREQKMLILRGITSLRASTGPAARGRVGVLERPRMTEDGVQLAS